MEVTHEREKGRHTTVLEGGGGAKEDNGRNGSEVSAEPDNPGAAGAKLDYRGLCQAVLGYWHGHSAYSTT